MSTTVELTPEEQDVKNRLKNIFQEEQRLSQLELQVALPEKSTLHQPHYRGMRFQKLKRSDRIYSAFLVLVVILILYFTPYIKIVRNDENIYPKWMKAAQISLSVFISCIIYMTFAAKDRKTMSIDDYSVRYPKLIPFATVFMVITIIAYMVALWPAFSGFSILIVLLWCYFILHASYLIPAF